ncbi:antirepressor [Acidocella sp. MX-AZ02]|nr:antirepressor [Acidocella sp. MX-AZ02]
MAADVCRALGIYLKSTGAVNINAALMKLGDDEKGTNRIGTPGGAQAMAVISESGLYKLVMRSDKPEARQFQDWVTREVLPAIRPSG